MLRSAVACAALALAGCGGSSSDETGSRAPVKLIDGGQSAFEQRLEDLQGSPVVVNQWASWCGPCRFEMPVFARLARRYDGRVEFLGLDSMDARENAEEFLGEQRVPYDNFFDPDAEIARSIGGGRAWPTTVFFGSNGEVANTHFGAYDDAQQLDADVREYAFDG